MTIEIPLKTMHFAKENSKTFAAQVFAYPSTQANFQAYLEDFQVYQMSRIPILEFASVVSTDQVSYIDYLKRNSKTIQLIWEKNESLIFTIAKMPKWLSESTDSSALGMDQAWKIYQTHPPKDYNAWIRLIKAMSEYLETLKPEGKTVYYEVWNEPDLDYWLGTTDAYLKLFQKTVEAIREVDPDAKVGGPAVCNYYGKVDSNRQTLISEVLTHCKRNNYRIDYISFHGFTYSFYETFRDAKEYIKGILEELHYLYEPEIIVSEWNSPSDVRGSYSHCAAMMNGYYSFWKLGITHHTWAAWEDFQANTPNDYGLISRIEGDSKRGLERPVYWGFFYTDWLQKDSQGIAVLEYPSGFKFVISKITDTEFRCIGWKFVNHPDIRAVYYIMEAIPTEELIRDYKDSQTIRYYIHQGKSINGKRDKEFKEANRLYQEDLHDQDTFNNCSISFPGSKIAKMTNVYGVRSSYFDKKFSLKENAIQTQIQNNEVVVFSILIK